MKRLRESLDQMAGQPILGTEGYRDAAEPFFQKAESVSFAQVHHAVLHLIPTEPSCILDIGAGSGRDAAALAAMGHSVVAVEPVAELRQRATATHPSSRIKWIDDSLPTLTRLLDRGDHFDVVMLTAVWMHLDEAARRQAMPAVSRLVRTGGTVIMSLRHGPTPPGRRMFEVSADETIALASHEGLSTELRLDDQPSAYSRTDVTWTRLVFVKGG